MSHTSTMEQRPGRLAEDEDLDEKRKGIKKETQMGKTG